MTTEAEQLRQRIAELGEALTVSEANAKHWSEAYSNWVNTGASAKRIAELEARCEKLDEVAEANLRKWMEAQDRLVSQVQQAADQVRREDAQTAYDLMTKGEHGARGPQHVRDAILAKVGQPVAQVAARNKDAERLDWLIKNKHLDAWWSVGGVKDREQNIRDDIDDAMLESAPSQKGDN